jgi:hypothetical protein
MSRSVQGIPIAADRSVWMLLATNLFTAVLALVQQWDVSVLLWIYWGQNVVIGYFNVHRILDLDEFSTANFRMNNRPVKPTRETQKKVAWFFALHYGLFHLGYLVFLAADAEPGSALAMASIGICIVAFYLNHRFSYRYNQEQERGRIPNIGNIMFFPYLRVVPMHLMVILGGALAAGGAYSLLLFMALKTAADIAMHVVGHAMARGDVRRSRQRLPG